MSHPPTSHHALVADRNAQASDLTAGVPQGHASAADCSITAPAAAEQSWDLEGPARSCPAAWKSLRQAGHQDSAADGRQYLVGQAPSHATAVNVGLDLLSQAHSHAATAAVQSWEFARQAPSLSAEAVAGLRSAPSFWPVLGASGGGGTAAGAVGERVRQAGLSQQVGGQRAVLVGGQRGTKRYFETEEELQVRSGSRACGHLWVSLS